METEPERDFGMRTPEVALHILFPKPQSELQITDQFRVHSAKPMPNRWRRFWYWALLGWKWTKV